MALDRVLARLPRYEVDEAGVERFMGIVRSTRRLPVRFEPGQVGGQVQSVQNATTGKSGGTPRYTCPKVP